MAPKSSGIIGWLVVAGIVVVGAGGYYFYTSSTHGPTSSGVLKDLEQVSEGKQITKNAPITWSATACDYLTLGDVQKILGTDAYLPKDGYTANVCDYHAKDHEFENPKTVSLVILYRDFPQDEGERYMANALNREGHVSISGIAEKAFLEKDKYGKIDIFFYDHGTLGAYSLEGYPNKESDFKEIVKRSIARLPK